MSMLKPKVLKQVEQASWTGWEADSEHVSKQTSGGLGSGLALGIKQEQSCEIKKLIQLYDWKTWISSLQQFWGSWSLFKYRDTTGVIKCSRCYSCTCCNPALLSAACLNLFSFLLMKINRNERTPRRVETNGIYVSKLCSLLSSVQLQYEAMFMPC